MFLQVVQPGIGNITVEGAAKIGNFFVNAPITQIAVKENSLAEAPAKKVRHAGEEVIHVDNSKTSG